MRLNLSAILIKPRNISQNILHKDLAFSLHNKRRYFYSRGLKKPEVLEFSIDENGLFDFIQGNFPEYTMTYQRLVETHGQQVNYIQLAKI